MTRELKYNSLSTSNRYSYSHSTNISNYLLYNNIHHYHQQIKFKHLSSRIQQHQYQRKFLRSDQSLQQYQENNIHNSTNKVIKKK